MKIGERFYQNFELRVDVASDPEDTPFVVDLETAQVPPIEPAADEAEQAAQELAAAAAAMTQASPLAAAEPREPVPTPLELAVIALLDQPAPAPAPATPEPLADDEPDAGPEAAGGLGELAGPAPGSGDTAKQAPTIAAPKPAVATLALREPAPLPENPDPSHVHLVLDEGAERVVVTVAVRGNEVHVGLRASDDQVAAALARNAATLDHALRARGLDLAGFSAERDPARDEREQPREHTEPHERSPHEEPFRLEEIV